MPGLEHRDRVDRTGLDGEVLRATGQRCDSQGDLKWQGAQGRCERLAHSVRGLNRDDLVPELGYRTRPLAGPGTQVDDTAYHCGCW